MKRTILVCGSGRCGTSLMMQMLHRGGVPCVGRWPAFEDEHCGPGRSIDPEWMASKAGHAIKMLDPHRIGIPRGAYDVIWLSRDEREQAKSQAKFLSLTLGLPSPGRAQIRAIAASILKDKAAAYRAPAIAESDILHLRFEHVLGPDALSAVHMVADHIDRDVDINAMLGAIRPRDPRCAPGLDMELALASGSGAPA